MHALNTKRSTDVHKLAPDWASSRSDRGAVLELISILRSGNSNNACQWVYDHLVGGKLKAGSVWAALFLTTAEMVIRYKLGGIGGLALHSVTTTNALHYAFRTCADPETRLYVLMEAVQWVPAFVASDRGRGKLCDLKITEIPKVESPKSGADAVEQVFALLPPQRFQHYFRDRTAQDKATHLTYALVQKHGSGLFLETARQLICTKATVDSHHLKFPIAIFENSRYASPEWRPHLLAASVHFLHGTRMEDNPATAAAREVLGRS